MPALPRLLRSHIVRIAGLFGQVERLRRADGGEDDPPAASPWLRQVQELAQRVRAIDQRALKPRALCPLRTGR